MLSGLAVACVSASATLAKSLASMRLKNLINSLAFSKEQYYTSPNVSLHVRCSVSKQPSLKLKIQPVANVIKLFTAVSYDFS